MRYPAATVSAGRFAPKARSNPSIQYRQPPHISEWFKIGFPGAKVGWIAFLSATVCLDS